MKYMTVCCRLVAVCVVVVACGHGAGNLHELYADGNMDEVLRVCAECLEKTPMDESCLQFRAKALERSGRPGEAIVSWKAVLDVNNSNGEALDQLVHYARSIPHPKLGLWILERVSESGSASSAESRQAWTERIATRDSLKSEAGTKMHRGMVTDAIRLLRQARRYDGADIELRTALCRALSRMSGHGLTLGARTAPLRESLTLLDDRFLEPSGRGELESISAETRDKLQREITTYERAVDYQPWARAPFIAVVDSTSYFPWTRFRCDESQYADIRLEFPPGDGQFVLTEKSAEVRAGSAEDAPVAAVIRGSAGMVVLERGLSYFLVSSGDETAWSGWVRKDILREKNRITFELEPRGRVELRTAVTKANINVDVNGFNFWRGEVELEPYIRYEWSF